MSDWQCPYCPTVLKSEKAYNSHLATEHESFSDGTEVKTWTWASLDSKKDITKFMLLKFPETRAPKDGPLHAKILQHIIRATDWDSNKQKVVVEIDYEKWQHALDQLDDYGRMKEKLQTEDKKLYHKKLPDGTWQMLVEHRCILPSPTQMALAQSSEEAHRGYFSPIRQEHI